MDGPGQPKFSLRHIAAQHRDLQQRVRKVRQLLRDPAAEQRLDQAFVDLRLQLVELCDAMQIHFVQEAEGGYLEEAVARLPRLASEADALENEHPQLFLELKSLVAAANDAEELPIAWRQLGARFNDFADQALAHETAENRLLQQAFNEDPSLFD